MASSRIIYVPLSAVAAASPLPTQGSGLPLLSGLDLTAGNSNWLLASKSLKIAKAQNFGNVQPNMSGRAIYIFRLVCEVPGRPITIFRLVCKVLGRPITIFRLVCKVLGRAITIFPLVCKVPGRPITIFRLLCKVPCAPKVYIYCSNEPFLA